MLIIGEKSEYMPVGIMHQKYNAVKGSSGNALYFEMIEYERLEKESPNGPIIQKGCSRSTPFQMKQCVYQAVILFVLLLENGVWQEDRLEGLIDWSDGY